MQTKTIPAVLSIAGSDSSGGAGIQADIKTIAAHRLFAETAITALTAQNTTGVRAVQEATPEFVAQQIDAVFEDIPPAAVKIGMVSSAAIIETIAERLKYWSAVNIAHVERLIAEGRMQPSGLAVFEARREDRSGYSYENGERELPPGYAAQLADSPAATAFWEVATPSYRKQAITWVLTAKQEATRDRRMAQLVSDSAAGRLIPSQRYGTTPKWAERAAAAAARA